MIGQEQTTVSTQLHPKIEQASDKYWQALLRGFPRQAPTFETGLLVGQPEYLGDEIINNSSSQPTRGVKSASVQRDLYKFWKPKENLLTYSNHRDGTPK